MKEDARHHVAKRRHQREALRLKHVKSVVVVVAATTAHCQRRKKVSRKGEMSHLKQQWPL